MRVGAVLNRYSFVLAGAFAALLAGLAAGRLAGPAAGAAAAAVGAAAMVGLQRALRPAGSPSPDLDAALRSGRPVLLFVSSDY